MGFLRLDKYLKLSRLVKRRATAQEMINVGAVRLNGREVKPSAEVSEGDEAEIAYPRRLVKVRVINADEKALKRGAEAYETLEERRVSGEEQPW
jgi:ribosomal 50S subunit-recycling heat shock protein